MAFMEIHSMSKEQEAHLERITRWMTSNIEEKYRLGQQEHGGNLWQRDTLVEAQREITDLNTYLYCVSEDRRSAQEAAVEISIQLRQLDKEQYNKFQSSVDKLFKALHIP